jgi:hypothetical protein
MTDFQQRLLAAAIRAPSGDNCQPWRFRFDGEHSAVITANLNRAKSFFDFANRATALSIGAAVENMRVQAASEGWSTAVRFGHGGEKDLSAMLAFSPGAVLPSRPTRVAALFQRTVNRRPFLPVPLSKSVLARLRQEPVEGTTVQIINDRHTISEWARVIELADHVRYSHPVIHEELFSKILFTRRQADLVRMGLEVDRLGLGPFGGTLLRWLRPWTRMQRLSRWGLIRILAHQSALLARCTGALVLVTIPTKAAHEDWMRGGEQVERLWIQAQEIGLQTHPMPVALYLDQRYQTEGAQEFLPSHLGSLQELRSLLASLVPTETGAMIFRVGWGWQMRGQSVRLPADKFCDA